MLKVRFSHFNYKFLNEIANFCFIILGQNEAKEWVPDNTDETIPNISLPIDVEKSVELLLQRARLKAEAKQQQNKKAATATPEVTYTYAHIKVYRGKKKNFYCVCCKIF